MKACLFTRTKGARLFETVAFLANDLRILRELGFDVVTAGRVADISWDADVYVSWFPFWAPFSSAVALIRRKPHLVIGNLSAAIPKHVRPRGFRYRVLLVMERLGVKMCSATLPTSNFELQYFRQLRARNPVTVYNCVDVNRYTVRKELPRGNEQVLVISRLTEENYVRKCIGQVIESIPLVASRFPRVRYVLFGSVNESNIVSRILNRASELGVRGNLDLLTEMVSESAKIGWLHSTTVYLQPTLYEGFGLAIAEAMSCGVPVVTSRSGSVPEVVGDCALYADPQDPRDIANQTIRLLRDPDLQRELGKRGRRRVEEHFTYERRKAALGQVLGQLLDCRLVDTGSA